MFVKEGYKVDIGETGRALRQETREDKAQTRSFTYRLFVLS